MEDPQQQEQQQPLQKEDSLSQGALVPKQSTASKQNLSNSSQKLFSQSQTLAKAKGSIRNLKQTTQNTGVVASAGGEELGPPNANQIVYENTYKLKPDRKFQSGAVKKVVDEILQQRLQKVKFDNDQIPELVKSISNEVLQAVKKFDFDRYKFVVDVTIGEFKGQGIKVASRCVWDTTTDSYASSYFRNATLFAVAIVFGGFHE